MVDPMARGSRTWLTLQWQSALVLLVVAIALGGLDIALALSRLPPESGTILILGILGVSVGMAGYALHLFRVVTHGEARLRGQGAPWRAERSLVTTRRSLVTDTAPETALSAARVTLSEPRWGLTQVGRGLLGSLCAVRPAVTELGLITVMPLAIRIRARRRRGRTLLTISIVPFSVFSWGLPSAWASSSSMYTWLVAAQELADGLTDRLAQSVHGAVGSSVAPARDTPV